MARLQMICCVITLLSVAAALTTAQDFLPFLTLGSTPGVDRQLLPRLDDGCSGAIAIEDGFPFGGFNETQVYVCNNGVISFRRAVTSHRSFLFPSSDNFTVAAFWANNDIRLAGEVSYEVHSDTDTLLQSVSTFISSYEESEFLGTWMLVAEWNQVHPHPHGLGIINSVTVLTNSYQAILITNGTHSYAVFTYQCGSMEWAIADYSGATYGTIGYWADGDFFKNHPLSGTPIANDIACVNLPYTIWSNVGYRLHEEIDATDILVEIIPNPPGPVYPAAIWIGLECTVDLPSPRSNITTIWRLFCVDDPFIEGYFPIVNRFWSTPPLSFCLNAVQCIAFDAVGNTGESQPFVVTNITGAGLFGDSEPISNNSALRADDFQQIGEIYCHSASRESGIGQWFSPAGEDITFNFTDKFRVQQFGDGSFPSFVTLELNEGTSLLPEDQGVYTCVIPDENGIPQTLHVGLYRSDYNDILTITAERLSVDPVRFSCVSRGLPSTSVRWLVPGIADPEIYLLRQRLRDGTTSTYDNILTVNLDLESTTGLYHCDIDSEETNQTAAQPTTTTYTHLFQVANIGQEDTLFCPVFNEDSLVEWVHEGEVILSVTGENALLEFPVVNDSLHGEVYICRVYFIFFFLLAEFDHTVIVNVPEDVYTIEAETTGISTAGQSYTVECTAMEIVEGLSNRVELALFHSDGIPVVGGEEILLENSTIIGRTTLTLQFLTLRTSHAQTYTCEATLVSPALHGPLIKTATVNVTVEIPPPVVNITQSASPLLAGSSASLTCRADIDEAVDTGVVVMGIWRKEGEQLLNSDNRITISDIIQIDAFAYEFTLTLAPLSLQDGGDFTCEVYINASSIPLLITSGSGTATHSLTVEAPEIEVDVTPTSQMRCVSGTFSSFTLTCTATVPSYVTLAKDFRWKIGSQGSEVDVVYNGINVIIIDQNVTSPTSTSVLTVHTPPTVGDHRYVCEVALPFQPETEDITASNSAGVTVKGIQVPSQPIDLNAINLTHESTIIQWTMSAFSCSPESFQVHYSADGGSLMQSDHLMSEREPSLQEVQFSVELTGLKDDTMYTYKVVVTNAIGSTESDSESFMSPRNPNVPPPVVNITQSASPLFAGSSASLTCRVDIDEAVDTGVVVMGIWRKEGEQLLNSDNRITISDLIQIDAFAYEFTLTLAPLSLQDDGDFTCEVFINASSIPSLITSGSGTATHSLTVEAPEIQVDVTPTSQTRCVSGTFSSFTLTCTATVPSSVTLAKDFRWKIGPQGSEVDVGHDGINVIITDQNITSRTSTSVLTVQIATIGNHRYVCEVALPFQPETEDITASNSAGVTVKGIQAPSQPINLNAINLTHESTIIQWTMSAFSCSPESFQVQYSADGGSLMQSDHLVSEREPSLQEVQFSVELTGLKDDTMYTYKVVVTNGIGSTESDSELFMSPRKPNECNQAFQVLLEGVGDCTVWRHDDTAAKLDRFAAELLDLLQDSPGVEISMDRHFDCCDDPNMVIFRAQLLGQEPDQCDPSLEMIEEWVQGAPTVIILGNRLTVVSTSAVIINSFDDPCTLILLPPSDQSTTEEPSGGAIAGIVIAIVVVLIVAALVVVVVVVCFLQRRKSKRQEYGFNENPAYASNTAVTSWAARSQAHNPYQHHNFQRDLPPPPYAAKAYPDDFVCKPNPLAIPEEPYYERTGSENRRKWLRSDGGTGATDAPQLQFPGITFQNMDIEHGVTDSLEMDNLGGSRPGEDTPADLEVPPRDRDDSVSQDNYVQPDSEPPMRRENPIGRENSKKGKGDYMTVLPPQRVPHDD